MPATGFDPVLVTERVQGPLHRYFNRAGLQLHAWDERHFATVELSYLRRTIGDPLDSAGAEGVRVTDGDGNTDITDSSGAHGLTGSLDLELDGPELQVNRRGALVSASGTDDILLTGGEDISAASASVLHHFHVVWDWLGHRWPEHPWLDRQVQAEVDRNDGACNAWYTNGTLTFLQGYSGACYNFGEIADVTYHEVGHGIHHYILQGGSFAGDVSEGSADYVSATINDDPVIGPNFGPSGGHIREIAADRVYPTDVSGQVHNDGLIWASFLWNLRAQWRADLGAPAGVVATDRLLLGALEQGPTLTDLYEAVILADDDNGDLTDGTPHACELVTLLDQHGLGPGPIGVVSLDHAPLGPQASTARAYPLDFTLSAPTAACADLAEDSIRLWWTTDPTVTPGLDEWAEARPPGFGGVDRDTAEPAFDTADTGSPEPSDPYGRWHSLPLTRTGGLFSGSVPRQPATTDVFYFIEAASSDGAQVLRSHAGQRSGLHRFTVGDTEALWCEDFEGGASGWTHGAGTPWNPGGGFVDEWVIGPATEGAYGPAVATSGTQIAATAPGATYRNNNRQYLQSPDIAVPAPRPLLRLSYQRWLTVEDGLYDHAILWGGPTGDALWWESPSTARGGTHVLDADWTLQEFDLAGAPPDSPTLRLTWTLDSDPGLEFGGWHIDDVCITALADPPLHYRRVGLDASDTDAPVTLTWEQPWMLPLVETVLVKRSDAWPEGPEDPNAEVLARYPDAVAGEALSMVDPDVAEGESAYYALFAFDGETWTTDAILGENADVGGVAVPEVGDTAVADSGDAAGDGGDGVRPAGGEEKGGCGCAVGLRPGRGGAGWLVLGIGVLVGLRRR